MDFWRCKFNRSAEIRLIASGLCLALGLFCMGAVLADVMTGGNYTMPKDAVSSGGSTIAGGAYNLIQVIGQPGGVSTVIGGSFELQGGYLYKNTSPIKPTCVAPISNAEVSDDTPAMQWSAFSDPDSDTQGGWQIQIDSEDDWDGSYVQTPSANTAVSEYELVTPLPAADIYYWRVRVKDQHGLWSSWSDSASFRQLHIYVDDSAAPSGNGTSTSQYQTITAAISAVTANFTYSIHVAAGTYTEQVDLTGKNAKLYGAGQGSAIVDGGATRSYGIYIHHSSTTSASLVDGFTFQNATADGARIQSGTGIQFTNCTFTSNGVRGIYILTSATTATFTNCVISNNCVTDTDEEGIRIDNGAAVVIDNCDISGNYLGIETYYGNWTVKDSYIHDNNYAGIRLYYRDTGRAGIVRDSIICKNSYYGLMHYNNDDSIVWNNVIGGNGDNGDTHCAIYMYDNTQPQIVGNKIVGQYGYAIRMQGKDTPLINNNTIYANNSYGVFWDYESAPTAYNNTIVSNSNSGVYKNAYVLNEDEDIQYNNVWDNTNYAYYNCNYSNGISANPLFTVSDFGTSTSVTTDSLTDTSKNWGVNDWKGYILIPDTTDRKHAFIVVSNTANTLTVGSWDTAYEVSDFASAADNYEITDLSLQGGSPNIAVGHTAERFSNTYGSYDRNDIGATGGYGPVPRAWPYNVSAGLNKTGVALNAQCYQGHPDKNLTFTWAQTAGTSVTLSDVNSQTPTFTAPATVQTLTFTVTVNDGYADSAVSSCSAYINDYVTVNGSGEYTSINAAIDSAAAGQTVNVPAGHFIEEVDLDGKAITLDGADNYASIIDGDNRINYAIRLDSNELNTTIVQDLDIRNSYREAIRIYDTVAADNTSPIVQNNYVHDNYRALYVYMSNPTVTGNYFVKSVTESSTSIVSTQSAGTYKKNHFAASKGYGLEIYPADAAYVPSLENNIFAANLSYGIYSRNANSSPVFINNVIFGNQSYGVRSYNYASTVVTNNIVASNYSYGLRADTSGTFVNTYNDVWNNSSNNYNGCSAGTGDISADPAFVIADFGTSTGITKTTLTDTSKTWNANQWRGYYLVPDTADKYTAMIWSNTADTLTVINLRDISWSASTGNFYRIIGFNLEKTSPCIDTATNTGAPADDFWGDTRPYDNGFAYYDNVTDMGIDETAYSLPGKPTIGAPQALSTTSIRWNFTDTAADESGFKVHDAAHVVKASDATANINYIDETGLSANTQYTRHVVSYNTTVIPNSPNANGESDDSAEASCYTLCANADVTETHGYLTSTWYQGDIDEEANKFVFTFGSANLNSGAITYYRYVWNSTSDTTVTGSDTQWSSSTISVTPANGKDNYLHVLAYNGDGVAAAQGTQHYGPYYFVNTSKLLHQWKFFDDNNTLIEMGPKAP